MANLEALKQKYHPVIEYAKSRGVSWKNVHVENEKLLIRGAAPNAAIKNEVWGKIKDIDPVYADLTADIAIDASLKYRVGPVLTFDPTTEKFVDNDAANKMLTRQYRKPFVVPDKVV